MLPGPGDQVDLAAGAGAVGEHRDRLGAADGVDLLDAEQRAGRQDRRVRQAAVVALRGARSARSTRRRPPGPARRSSPRWTPAARCRRARRARPARSGTISWRDACRRAPPAVVDVLLELGLAGGPQPADRLLEPGADVGVERARARRASAATGTAMSVCSTPSNRAENSVTASTPRWRTASQIGRTTSRAASTSKSARGTTAR